MAIKAEADEIFFSKHPEQRELALQFAEAFDVTHGDSIDQLYFWLLEPQQHAKERFGFIREVLAIYSPFPKTDARVITAIGKITSESQHKHRVEKVLVVLIHRGDVLEARELIQGQRDFVIVPFSVDELLDKAKGSLFVRSRLSGEIGSIDLFGMSSPLTSDKYFFGRDELVQRLISRSLKSSESSGLFGLRKTGKTSVLYAIARRLKELPALAVYVDCQNPGAHGSRWWDFLESLASRCAEVLHTDRRRFAKLSSNYARANCGLKFSSDIRAILNSGNIDHIVIMFDEVEYITPSLSGATGQHWDEDFFPFWQTIRAVKQETQGKLSFIVAGVNPLCVTSPNFSGKTNPIFQLALPQYLQPLPVESVRNMVHTIARYSGIVVAEPLYPYLVERYGGHPYLIRVACSEVWASKDVHDPFAKASVVIKDFEILAEQIRARLSQPIKDILLSLVWWYPDEYDLLRIIADGDAQFVEEYLAAHPAAVVQFVRYGLLRDSGDFAISDLREFLREHGSSYKDEVSPFIRGDMPQDLLPEIPDIALLGRLFERRTEVEVMLRRVIIMYLGVRCNWDPVQIAQYLGKSLPKRKDRPNPESLFVGRPPNEVVQDLYTLDLKAVLVEHWDVFKSLFENQKQRLEMNLDTINRARRVDAHTKPVSQDEALEFENSYLWLKSKLRRVPGV